MRALVVCIVFIVLEALFIGACWWATSPSVFYAGQHDDQCEKLGGEKECLCYQRLVAE